ncbi:dynamin family protein [Cercophora scortea]|uniref:Dynamin family protein n=1 Tax=Cercophora scortea TaxID=314031 RepID=A0AAE0M422_9PEZI|nr:dynamin family protein [Cercophora scortea]
MADDSNDGLGNRALLDKVDKLRELGISSQIPLPQIVVVGDQSSGKSSTLESLTGFHMPRSVTLCTRYATEIICRREQETSLMISIQPAHGCSPNEAARKREFRRSVRNLGGQEFMSVLEEIPAIMGIKANATDKVSCPTFSRDVLRIEKSGPQEEHLTIIDVPGIFENESPGLTTKDDIALVEGMVKHYIKDSRTIILAVVPCNVDIATQKIIKLASEADPEGKRTLGVLTKPDLVLEQATINAVTGLIKGQRRDLQLGYCVVRNRGADDLTSSLETRNRAEMEFFSRPPWSQLDKTRLGIPALRARLRELLMDRTKSEFPKVKREIMDMLKDSKQQLEAMGPARSEPDEQRAYLGAIEQRYTEMKKFGLDAYYTGHPVFSKRDDLKLITRIRELNEAFSKVFFEKAHSRSFNESADPQAPGETDSPGRAEKCEDRQWASSLALVSGLPSTYGSDLSPGPRDLVYDLTFLIPVSGESDLDGILSEPLECLDPDPDSINEHLEELYLKSRGYELGTFNWAIIPTSFRDQAKKWENLTLAHVSNAILVVHHFIHEIIWETCPDAKIRTELWAFILDDLLECYHRAMEHAKFLLHVELNGNAVTCNPEFDSLLRRARHDGIMGLLQPHAVCLRKSDDPGLDTSKSRYVLLDQATAYAAGNSSLESICSHIHDVVKCYYNVARSRFVDNICVQVIEHFLLSGDKGPLRVFCSSHVLKMSAETLDAIAGEDIVSRSRREALGRSIKRLEEARKVVHG